MSATRPQVRHRPDAPQGARVLHRPHARAGGGQRRHLRRARAHAAVDGSRDRGHAPGRSDRDHEAAGADATRSCARAGARCPTSRRSSRRACSPRASTSARAGRRRCVIGVPDLRAPARRRRHHRLRLGAGRRRGPDRHAERRARASSPTGPARRARHRRRRQGPARCAISGVRAAISTGGQDRRRATTSRSVLRDAARRVAALSGAAGYTSLALRLRDTSRPAAERTVAAVRDQLRATTASPASTTCPSIRKPGSYPGKEPFEQASPSVMT